MTEQEILETIRRSAIEDHEYFSNKNKPNRERYIVSLFLKIFDVDHREDDLRAEIQSSSVDVSFECFRFQIKELMDEGFSRGKFYKDCRMSAVHARSLADLSLVSECHDVPFVDTMYNLVLKKIPSFSGKYTPDDRKKNDLLIYITRSRAALFCDEGIMEDHFSFFGWRTISCVNEKQAVVLFSSNEAPELMKRHSGQVIWRRAQ